MKKILFFWALAAPLLAVNMDAITGTWENQTCKRLDDGHYSAMIYHFAADGKASTFMRYYETDACTGKTVTKAKESGNYRVTPGDNENALKVAITYSRRNKIDLLLVSVGNNSLQITNSLGKSETFKKSTLNE